MNAARQKVRVGKVVEVDAREMDVDMGYADVIVIDRRHNHVPHADRKVGLSVVVYSNGVAPHEHWCAAPLYGDTEAGARGALMSMLDRKAWIEWQHARFFPDPSVPGVWGADLPDGRRIIIYLAGYPEFPHSGTLRMTNDFEEGQRP